MEKKYVEYNGARVIEGWPERIEAAQLERSYVIRGVAYARVAYGDESDDWGADTRPCHDCAVVKGQLHVVGCDVERCPVCDGQTISCDCLDELDEESAED